MKDNYVNVVDELPKGDYDPPKMAVTFDDDDTPSDDPFAPGNIEPLTLITLMRVYDVGMALLKLSDSDAADRLHSLHDQGKILGSFPWLDAEE